MSVIQFILVPDGSSARHVRRLIAERGACSGAVVGTWLELVAWANRAYLVPAMLDDWETTFRLVLEALDDAFWRDSYLVAPDETSEAVRSALVQIVSATAPGDDIDELALEKVPERPRRHLADLIRLTRSLSGHLPEELASIQALLSTEAQDALHFIRVVHADNNPALTRWQTALLNKLNRDAQTRASTGEPDEPFADILASVLAGESGNAAHKSLDVLQTRLFEDAESKSTLDDSVQWVGARDYLQEAEVASGMVQTLLAEKSELRPAEIGLLVPDSFEYAVALEDAFHLGGIAMSGLPVERWRRDLGREAVFHFLYCRQKPAPAMALAVCLASPLMPWPRKEGAMLAQAVMDGNYEMRPPPSADSNTRAMLKLIRTGDSETRTLSRALKDFLALLGGSDEYAGHVLQARAAIEQLQSVLESTTEIDWVNLRRVVNPRFITSGESPDFNIEGVSVWRESQEPWRPVRHLIVFGFAQGHYPLYLGSNPVFSADDIKAIRDHVALAVVTPTEELIRGRQLFKRQLGAVSESVTFLVPRRDPGGRPQSPSESLVFMHQLFEGPESPDELVIELDAADDRVRVRHLALAAPDEPRAPRILCTDDVYFDRDLLALRTDAEGELKPESPSSLETLMVSRLAWLLRRVNAEPTLWAPESAEPTLLGTLTHKVFEGLFRTGEDLPSRERIPGEVEALVDEAIQGLAPFLRTSQWQVERQHFIAETIKAAQTWRDVLERLGADVLGSEAWLEGSWSGIPIHGQTDLILGLSENRMLVVDYKRSKSSSRRPRMEKGYDSQASLYRAMLESGGPKDYRNETLLARLRSTSQTGIVYYMLNDQVSLSDTLFLESGGIPGWEVLENDVAGQAMGLIRQRIAEVREGLLCLNREGDAEFFEKQAGIKPYALENSPLIGLFTLPGDAVEAQ